MPGAFPQCPLPHLSRAVAPAPPPQTALLRGRAACLAAAAVAAALLAACETERTVVSEGRRLDPTHSSFGGSYNMVPGGAGGEQAQGGRRSMLEGREFRSAAPRNFRSPSREFSGPTEYRTQQSNLPQPSREATRTFATRPAGEQGGAFRQPSDAFPTQASREQGTGYDTGRFPTTASREANTSYQDGGQSETTAATPYRVDDTDNVQTLESYNRQRSVPEVRRLLGKD